MKSHTEGKQILVEEKKERTAQKIRIPTGRTTPQTTPNHKKHLKTRTATRKNNDRKIHCAH